MTFALCPREAHAGSLQPLYEFVQEALKPVASEEAAWRCPVLLVDDLSVLLSLGVGAVAVLDFIHYCEATVCCTLQVPRVCRAVEALSPWLPDLLSQLEAGSYLVPLLQGNVVALVHDSGDAEDEENNILLNGLSHQSHLILRAEGLATGFCRDVHGQVCRNWDQDPPGQQAAHEVVLLRACCLGSCAHALRFSCRGCLAPCTMGLFHGGPV